MLEQLFCIGLNHHTAPIEIREQVAFAPQEIGDAVLRLLKYEGIGEAVILSTCNRVEIYAVGQNNVPGIVKKYLHDRHSVSDLSLSSHLYVLHNRTAALQLFRVAAALDAAVIGETQIAGQIRHAYQTALDAGGIKKLLAQLFQRAFATAKRVRTETEIGRHAVSLGFAAVELAKKIFGDVSQINCLLVGAGEMAEIAAASFHGRGAQIHIANRSLNKAQELANQFHAVPYALGDLPKALCSADVVVTSTSAASFLISPILVSDIMRQRRYRPLFFADMSVPRNVDPAVANHDGVYVYDIDDLGKIVQNNLKHREMHALIAEQIVEEEVTAFQKRLLERNAAPMIQEICQEANEIAISEVRQLLSSFGSALTPNQQRQVEEMALSIAHKTLHRPLIEIKQLAAAPLAAFSAQDEEHAQKTRYWQN